MTIKEITSVLEAWAPLSLQEHYDNSGLILGSTDAVVQKVLICFDLKPEVIDEAITLGANLIISHHPAIFKGLKHLNPSTLLGSMLKKSLAHDIGWYAMHTNFDNIMDGVNKTLADVLQLKDRHPVMPAETIRQERGVVTIEETGVGIVGECKNTYSGEALLLVLKDVTGVPVIRHSGNIPSAGVRRIALCGGAGAFLVDKALALGADVLITGDVRYHDFFDAAAKGLWVIDVGHFESEQFAKQTLLRFFTKNFPTFAALVSEKETPTVYYF
jgi:dinuclear metal center YbgI/SA1388 family protein